MDPDIPGAQSVLDKLGPWIRKYSGGLPPGVLAEFIWHESGGNFSAPGDPTLGEVGFLQVAGYVPPLFGLPAEARNDPESNIAIGSLEYALEAINFYLSYPDLVQLGTPDSWMLARLAFAVGRAGSHQLADSAIAAGLATPGHLYDAIVQNISNSGAPWLGSQDPNKVASRVYDIPRQWAVGTAIDGTSPGPPTTIPDPPAGKVTIPAEVAPYFSKPLGVILLIGGAAALMLYWIWRRTR